MVNFLRGERRAPYCERASAGALRKAIAKLKSLHDGDVGAVETIACGAAAISPVRAILFAREPSGLYETRRRAVEVLSALKAYDVLREFLEAPHDFDDPVEQTGDDAVVNAAARALGELGDTKDLPLLLALLRHRRLAGIIEAVGRFRRIEALPYFIGALADDFTRPSAEAAILKLGAKARPALLESVQQRQPPAGHEVDSSRQRRRSALRLLLDIGIPGAFVWPPLHGLVHDPDPWVAMLAARLCLASKMNREKRHAIARLIALLKYPDALLIAEIEDCLTAHFEQAFSAIAQAIETGSSLADPDAPWWLQDKALAALLRVKARHSTQNTTEDDRMERDTELHVPAKPREYRLGVGIMLLNKRHHVLLCRRVDVPGGAWQMPQGGVDQGENLRTAALRELKEEIGTDNATILAESRDWLQYDLPPELLKKAWGGRYAGQRQKWLLMQFEGRDEDIDLASNHAEFDGWIWVRPADVPDLVVAFKREVYRQVLAEFKQFLNAPSSAKP